MRVCPAYARKLSVLSCNGKGGAAMGNTAIRTLTPAEHVGISSSMLSALAADIDALVARFAEEAEHGMVSEQTAQGLAMLLSRAHQIQRRSLPTREFRSL